MPSPPDAETLGPDRAHALLADAIRSGRVQLGVSMAVMGRPGSPVFRRWEAMLPSLIAASAVLAALGAGGWPLGIVALGLALLAWFRLVAPWLRDRVHDRTQEAVLSDRPTFEDAWNRGAVSLNADKLPPCAAPAGDWVDWTRSLAGQVAGG